LPSTFDNKFVSKKVFKAVDAESIKVIDVIAQAGTKEPKSEGSK
jgi:hypothetical protein